MGMMGRESMGMGESMGMMGMESMGMVDGEGSESVGVMEAQHPRNDGGTESMGIMEDGIPGMREQRIHGNDGEGTLGMRGAQHSWE